MLLFLILLPLQKSSIVRISLPATTINSALIRRYWYVKELDINKKRADYLIEEINNILELTNKYSDPAIRDAVVISLLPTLNELGDGQGLKQVLLVVSHDTTKHAESQ